MLLVHSQISRSVVWGLMTVSEKFSQILKNIKNSFIQECPPELYACEICKKLDCNNAEWIECQERQKSAEFMETLDKITSEQLDCFSERCAHVPKES